MYVMFVLVGAGGLIATAQLAPIAIDFQIAKIPVSLFGLTLPALTFALSIDRVVNGLTRPFFGWVSDHIGRENTMFIAFGFEAAGIWALSQFGRDPVLFVILVGLYSSPGERSTLCSLRRAPMPSASSTRPPMWACSTLRKAPPRFWCRSPTCWRRRAVTGGLPFSPPR
jgi:MFS family permease